MSNKYTQSFANNKTRFDSVAMSELEFSRFQTGHRLMTDFNAGDIVPIYCGEVLPHDTWDCDLDFVIRQATLTVPVMGALNVDYYAFFVPNRIVNQSWKQLMGENADGTWTQTEVTLAPLVPLRIMFLLVIISLLVPSPIIMGFLRNLRLNALCSRKCTI